MSAVSGALRTVIEVGGVVALVVVLIGALVAALFYLARAIRGDSGMERRLTAYIHRVELAGARDRARIFQLEDVLRDAGLPVPPWPDLPDPAPQMTRPRRTR